MKISIWQQFSSNHSASFTVIGKFPTAADAQRAGNELKSMLTEIGRWREQDHERKWQQYLAEKQIQNPTDEDGEAFETEYYQAKLYSKSPTTFEETYREKYGIKHWPTTLQFVKDAETAPNVVVVYDRAVIVAEDFIDAYTWTGIGPFWELLEKFGGEVALENEGSLWMTITVNCKAPNETTRDLLIRDVKTRTIGKPEQPDTLMLIQNVFVDRHGDRRWSRGNIKSEGLHLTYSFDGSLLHGRHFMRLIDYLKANGCTDIDYHFETHWD